MASVEMFVILGFICLYIPIQTVVYGMRQSQGRVLLIAGHQTVSKVHLQSKNFSFTELPFGGASDGEFVISALDFDRSSGYFYASQVDKVISTGRIWRAKLDGTEKETVLHLNLGHPEGIAVDSFAGNIYWTDSDKYVIEVYNLKGKYRRVLVTGIDNPKAICVDPLQGYMFWSDWGYHPSITRAYLDGSHTETIVHDDITWPNGLVIDPVSKKVYWGDAKHNKLEVADYDGQNRNVLINTKRGHISSMSLLGKYVYWADRKMRVVERVNKFTGSKLSVIYTNNAIEVNGLVAVDTESTVTVTNACGVNNGNCSHFCFYRPPPLSRVCVSNEIESNGTETMLLVAYRLGLRQVFPAPPKCTMKRPIKANTTYSSAISVDCDIKRGFMYWADFFGSIFRAKLDGSDQELVLKYNEITDGIAIDWIANNLYWTHPKADVIGVINLDNKVQIDVITEGLDRPRTIVLDPAAGYMYWTDWGAIPIIERAYLDGSNREVIVNDIIRYPNGLALDLNARKLYWGDGGTDKIERCDLDGGNRKVVISAGVKHIFGMSLLGNNIYWTDWQTHSIQMANKNTGGNLTVICPEDNGLGIMGLKAVDTRMALPGNNSCGSNNGDCSHLCLYRPSPLGRLCACPKGLQLHLDGLNCIRMRGHLILALKSEIRFITMDSLGPEIQSIKDLGNVTAVDFYHKNNSVYWIDAEKRQINSMNLDDRAVRTVIGSDLDEPTRLAVDWVAGNLYWTDTGRGYIEMSRLNGSSRTILIKDELFFHQTLLLDPIRGYMYWTSGSLLEQAHLDGSNRRILVSRLGHLTDMVIDYDDGRLFWIDLFTNKIKSVAMNGRNIYVVTRGIRAAMAITIYNDNLYWASIKWNNVSDNKIVQGNKRDGMVGDVIDNNLEGKVIHLVYMHPDIQPVLQKQICPRMRYQCSHLCFALPANTTVNPSSTCGCPTHYTLNPGGWTCSLSTEYMLLSTNKGFQRIAIELGNETDYTSVTLPLHRMKNVKALAYDPSDNFVYWTQGSKGIVKRSHPDALQASVITTGPGNGFILADDIDIDLYTGAFYWTHSKSKVINVKRIGIDDASDETIMTSRRFRPKCIALYAEKGIMLFTNMLRQPRIERARMDGSGHTVILKANLGYPHSLVIDKRDVRLYWADASLNRIEASDLDGSNRVIVASSPANNFRALTIQGHVLYWLNKTNEMEGLSTEDFSQRITFSGPRSGKIDNFVAVSHPESMSWHPCYHDNGGCSHICFWAEKKAQCSCPIGLHLIRDNKTCVAHQPCKSNEFKCTGGDIVCIPLVWRCDHYPECEDDSDEKGCEYCNANEFTCLDGICLNKELVCDGKKHCHDGSDEFNCRIIYFNVSKNTENTHSNISSRINTSGSNNDTCSGNPIGTGNNGCNNTRQNSSHSSSNTSDNAIYSNNNNTFNGSRSVNFNNSDTNGRNVINQTSHNTSSETNQDIKVDCAICSQNSSYESIMNHYCNAEIVMKAVIKNFKDDGGNFGLKFRRNKELYKPKKSKTNERKILRTTPIIKGGSSCSCESMKRKRARYLLMGHKQDDKIVITYGIPMNYSDHGFRKAMKKITHWLHRVTACFPQKVTK